MQFQKVTMTETRKGSPDGIREVEYEAGAEYSLPEGLARAFVNSGWARFAGEAEGVKVFDAEGFIASLTDDQVADLVEALDAVPAVRRIVLEDKLIERRSARMRAAEGPGNTPTPEDGFEVVTEEELEKDGPEPFTLPKEEAAPAEEAAPPTDAPAPFEEAPAAAAEEPTFNNPQEAMAHAAEKAAEAEEKASEAKAEAATTPTTRRTHQPRRS